MLNSIAISSTYSSPVGDLTLVCCGEVLMGLTFPGHRPEPRVHGESAGPVPPPIADQLTAYFDGERNSFDIETAVRGTDFQLAVWRELSAIPFGDRVTYTQIANRIGKPKAVRAVGAAVGRNPISIVIPCHRVVGANGSLTGFAGGVTRKRQLLELENGRRGSGCITLDGYKRLLPSS